MVNLGAMGMPTVTRAYDCPFRSAVGLVPSHVTESPNVVARSAPLPSVAMRIAPTNDAERAQFSPYARHGRAPPLRPTPA